jgi:hypothetical protein
MKRQCPHCQAVLDFGDRPLSFCAFCGHSLGGSASATPVVAEPPSADPNLTTPAAPTSEAVTLAPGPGMAVTSEGDPEVVGNYRLLRRLGGGGMGTVYEAEENGSGRRVALKLISAGFAGADDAVERFRQEGRLASALVHPRCVFVYTADEERGRPYIVMELMPGETLEDLVKKRGPLPIPEAIESILDVIAGLQEAHQLGIIHRDVKPSNCFVEADGRVKVGDFGLAKSLAGNARLTSTGAFLGTPLYASPEQVRAEKLTPQTDIYSVAATLYFLLVGKAPFDSGDPVATLARIVTDDPPPMRTFRPEIPELLDRVVLRGLERARDRRYHDLEEFRQALRPFLTGKAALVGLGLRFGAYLVDYGVMSGIITLIGVVGSIGAISATSDSLVVVNTSRQHAIQLIGMLLYFLYFLPECFLGCSIGKGLLGLRVRRTTSDDPPGLWRGLLRNAVFVLLFNLGALVVMGVSLAMPPFESLPKEEQARALFPAMLLGLLPLVWMPVAIGLICSTMRARNGLRGLHDFVAGTRVVAVSKPRRRALVPVPQPWNQPDGLPEMVGPYRIKGALHSNPRTGVLLGEERSLGREVLLWLRPASMPAVDPERRRLCRVSRLRWLAAGTHGEQQYDAFLLPGGCTLHALVKHSGPLDWPAIGTVLDQLTKELVLACEEHTVPATVCPRQVWLQSNGRVLLLDPPLAPLEDSPDRNRALPIEEQEQETSLDLLADVGALTAHAEGCGRSPRSAPLPVHAVKMLDRLTGREEDGFRDLAEFQHELRETRALPEEVTLRRRLGHLAVQGAFLFVGLCCCMMPIGFAPGIGSVIGHENGIQDLRITLEEHGRGARRDLLVSVLNPNLWLRLTGAARYADDLQSQQRLREQLDQSRRSKEARVATLSAFMRNVVHGMTIGSERAEEEMRKQRAARINPLQANWQYRERAAGLSKERKDVTIPTEVIVRFCIIVAAWPTVWVLWAFITRGGLSLYIMGLTLVRRDNRKAARWRCAWRALLVWLPVTGLFVVSMWLEFVYWSVWREDETHRWLGALAETAWWSAVGLLAVWVILALRSPARTLHDRLAGTFLVPR